MTERVCIGAIAGAFGVQGEVRLKSFTTNPGDIATYGPLWTEDGGRSFSVRLTRPVTGGLGARLEGVLTREDAEALKGVTLWVDRSMLPSLPDDEFYHTDLIGLEVVDTGGAVLGRVHAIYDHGAGDILEITGAHAMMLPFTRAFVPTVDIEAGRIVVDPPEPDAEASAETAADGNGAEAKSRKDQPKAAGKSGFRTTAKSGFDTGKP